MTPNDYAGKGTLPPELEQRVQSELSAGERLAWIGRARPDLYRHQMIFMAIFGAIFGGVPLFILAKAFAAGVLRFQYLFILPFVLIGAYLLAAPIWMPLFRRRIHYAVHKRL